MNTIPNLIPNAKIAYRGSDKPIQVSLTDTLNIGIDGSCDSFIESMVPSNTESISSDKF